MIKSVINSKKRPGWDSLRHTELGSFDMQHFERQQKIVGLLTTALECSFYVSPKDPGLTYPELVAVGGVFDLKEGEIGDALRQVTTQYAGQKKLLPGEDNVLAWIAQHMTVTPEYISVAAFDFWSAALTESGRLNGAAHARVDRDTTIHRAEARGIRKHDMEVALAITTFLGHVADKDGVVTIARGRAAWPSISEQRNNLRRLASQHDGDREKVFHAVKDLIDRRTDGRASHAEPLDAFGESLEALGYRPFKLWWVQLVSQLRQSDPQTTPVAVLVLAAALVEGALTFVAKRGRSLNVGVFGSSTFKEEPHKWGINDLINGAAAGGAHAILTNLERQRADGLAKARQRIHAGRMLLEFPQGVPDLKPEEAREAIAVANLVVRRVLDWLQKSPAI